MTNWTEFREFHDSPRPAVLIELGLFSVELGQRQRICRGCRNPIPAGTYHLVGHADGGASLKLCQECTMALAGWIGIANDRGL